MKIGIARARSISDAFQRKADIRLYEVELKYDDDSRYTVEMYLDINGSIRNQIYQSFNPLSKDYPQIVSYKLNQIKPKSRRA